MTGADSIQPFHRQRLAVVYLRQSSPRQVQSNRESQLLQRSLMQRAQNLGWPADQVRVIDTDLGLSGRTAQGRAGLQELLDLVQLSRVGLVLAYEVTRFARNCSDWYPVLDQCSYHHCLVGDQDGIYDPDTPNGRMLLGMKGLISECELHALKLRLLEGLRNKAKRGELAQTLPVGLERDDLGQAHKHPDKEVQTRLELVFATFLRVGSLPKTLRFFVERNLDLPRRDRFGKIVWRRPTLAVFSSLLKNPAYAGAFVYGRTRSVRSGAGRTQQKPLPFHEWLVNIPDKYPAYVNWKTFEKIQAMLRDNYANYRDNQARGTPRSGKALLHGLLYCGVCGRRLVVQYKSTMKYLCNFDRRQSRLPVCQYLPAAALDAFVARTFLEALTPTALDLDARVLASWQQESEQLRRNQDQQKERLRYQAQLAEQRYMESDPKNRLVADELEKRWEQAMRALRQAETSETSHASTSRPSLSAEMRAAVEEAGRTLPEWWHQGRIGMPHQKALIRSLVDKVIVHRSAPDRVQVRLVWKGGETTTSEISVPVHAWDRLSNAVELKKRILKLVKSGLSDAAIAQRLTEEGHRSPRGSVLLPSTVQNLRLRHRIFRRHQTVSPRQVPGYLTVPQIAHQIDVPLHWIYDRIHNGIITVPWDESRRLYLFPDRPRTITQFQQLRAEKLKTLRF